jgi:hypothetical protein
LVAIVVVLVGCILVFSTRAKDPTILSDTDTTVLLQSVSARHAPLSWFTSDWPLGNHFYRPISTLFFEADLALHGKSADGYALTNVLLCMGCIVGLAWLMRELTDSPVLTGASALIFSLWHTEMAVLPIVATGLVWLICLMPLSLLRYPREYKRVLFAMLVTTMCTEELAPVANLHRGVVTWLPGRTASTMVLFGLLALAAYARYERVTAKRDKAELTAIDLPATKSAHQASTPNKLNLLWAVVACVFLIAAFGCYEQAIVLPGALTAIAVWLRLMRYRVRWGWQIAFWSVLIGYLALRHAIVPSSASGYQLQQFRTGIGIEKSISDLILPSFFALYISFQTLTEGWYVFMFSGIQWVLWGLGSNLATFCAFKKRSPLLVGSWALSFLVFLPMAWLKPFQHYYYLTTAFRAIFAAGLLSVSLELIASVASPPTLQAPKRLDPAPGSLLHR